MPTSPDSSLEIAMAHAALVHRLGGAACVVPVPAGGSPSLLEVGSLAGLPVWSAAVSAADAGRLARRLARRGALGVLLAQPQAGHALNIAVTLTPVRMVTVPAPPNDALMLRRLRHAALRHELPLAAAIALADALDLDAAGRRTFRLLHALVGQAIAQLPDRVPLDDRRSWALTQLTRLLFLRFVESEGWLDDNPRFLSDQFERCLTARRDPMRHLLEPLFFGTLNRPVAERSRLARSFGAIPFLNGGLFEPHPLERRWKMRLSADYWRDAFAALVDRVDVTLDHDVDDGRVSPELLGRVFEGVMDPDERRREGTFFTPPALVEQLGREAISCHLAAQLGRSEAAIASALNDPDPLLQSALLEIRVLDPAVGSGAFLVGMLALLHGPGPRDRRRVHQLVTSRLFGVDRHPGAVQLTELRLWLEVLRAERGVAPGELPPLPNLDTTIRAGDALIDPVRIRELATADSTELARRQASLGAAHGPAKRRATRALADAERAAAVRAIAEQERAIERRIDEVLSARRAPSLFGEIARLDPNSRRTVAVFRRERAAMREERRQLQRAASTGCFAMSVAFAPILSERGGFDLVVGNPPWVRAESVPPHLRRQLAARYRWWSGGDACGWHHLPDLAVAFVERSSQLLRSGGTLALLVPAKLATTGYATAMRAGLSGQLTLHRVADLADDPRANFDATTYPLAIVASRRAPPADHVIRLGLDPGAATIPQREWRGHATWSVAAPEAQALRTRLATAHPALGERLAPQIGLKTGANAVFLAPPEALHPYCRRAIRGRDVKAFSAQSRAALLWPADDHGVPWQELPDPVAHYLAASRARLQQRADFQSGPWWRLFRTSGATARHRVIWCDLAATLRATTLNQPDDIPLNSCYVVALPNALGAESLTAWLNSTWIRALAKIVAEPAANGYARFGARAVASVPLPDDILGDPVLAALTHAAADHDIQPALDRHVALRLGLDANDCRVLAAAMDGRKATS